MDRLLDIRYRGDGIMVSECCVLGRANCAFTGMWRDSLQRIALIKFCFLGIGGGGALDYTEGPPACFVVASARFLFEGYGDGGRWSNGAPRSTVAMWTLQRVAPAYAAVTELNAARRLGTFSQLGYRRLLAKREPAKGEGAKPQRWNLKFLRQKHCSFWKMQMRFDIAFMLQDPQIQ